MATKSELGTLQYIEPRNVWEHEAHDFTPWLEENIDLLGDAIGLDIEITGREVAVGSFSLDLLGKEANTERTVIIENQLERTDHDHLGKTLTYAAGLDARVIVWVSSDVRDEHREAIHWLNEHTAETVSFFAVEIEILRIGESLPALRLNVVAQPSEFQREVVRKSVAPPTARQTAYQTFFTKLVEALHSAHPGFTRVRADSVSTATGKNFSTGVQGLTVGAWFSGGGELWVETWIAVGSKEQNKIAFERLYNQREVIEDTVGGPLTWEKKEDRKGSRVSLRRPGSIDSSESELQGLSEWAVDLLPKFRDAFAPRIAALDLDALVADATRDNRFRL